MLITKLKEKDKSIEGNNDKGYSEINTGWKEEDFMGWGMRPQIWKQQKKEEW